MNNRSHSADPDCRPADNRTAGLTRCQSTQNYTAFGFDYGSAGTDSTIIVTIRPNLPRESAGIGRFDAFIGERWLCCSWTPLLKAARVLLAEGVAPSTALLMRHEDSTTIALISTVGRAAALTVHEGERGVARFTRFKPIDPARARARRRGT